VSLREDLIAVLAEELEADCNPVVALDTVLDYLESHGTEWRRQAFDDPYYNNPGTEIPALIAALRIQENQP
jgi:hypothetical protein